MNKVAYTLSENLKAQGFVKKEKYTIEEYVEDLKNLQRVVATTVFGEEAADTARLEAVIRHLEQTASEQHKFHDPRVSRGLVMLKGAARDLAVTIAGANAENRVAATLEHVERDDCFFWRNIFLTDGIDETEADFIVLTAGGIVILEVKAAKENIVIDEAGRILYNGTTCYCDTPISEKLSVKRDLLRKKLEAAFAERGISADVMVDSILVFSTPLKVNIMIADNYHKEKICTRGKLAFLMNEYETGFRYTREEMLSLIEILDGLESHRKGYEADMDMDALREAFAEMLVTLGQESDEIREEANVLMRRLEKQGVSPESLGIFDDPVIAEAKQEKPAEPKQEEIPAPEKTEKSGFVGFVMSSGDEPVRGSRRGADCADRVGDMVSGAMARFLQETKVAEAAAQVEAAAEVSEGTEEVANVQAAPAAAETPVEKAAPAAEEIPAAKVTPEVKVVTKAQPAAKAAAGETKKKVPVKNSAKLNPVGVLAGTVLVGLVAYLWSEKFSA